MRSTMCSRHALRRAATIGGSLAAAATLGVGLAGPALASSSASDFAALRQCESSGDYSINTGNGYYGAYQFDLTTWHWLGYVGLPSDASPAVQDEAAQRLQAIAGWQPWPACSRKLGLSGGPAEQGPPVRSESTTSSTSTASTSTTGSATAEPASYAPTSASYASYAEAPAAQPVLSRSLHAQWSRAVATWQAQMAHRGWTIAVDGYFGPQSAKVAHQFEVAHHLTVDKGIVGPQIWYAAWHSPTS